MTERTIPIDVRIPVPAAVTSPSSGRERVGYVWMDRTVEVPALDPEARVTVRRHWSDATLGPPPLDHPGVRETFGVCQDGRHWRRHVDTVAPPLATFAPFLPVHDDKNHPLRLRRADTACRWSSGYPGVVPPSETPDAVSHARCMTLGIMKGDAAALGRYSGDRSPGDLSVSKRSWVGPFDVRDGHTVRVIDPSFEAHVLERVRSEVALLGVRPMFSSPPPAVMLKVNHRRRRIDFEAGYADLAYRTRDQVVFPLPHQAYPGFVEALKADPPPSLGLYGYAVLEPKRMFVDGDVLTPGPTDRPAPSHSRLSMGAAEVAAAMEGWIGDFVSNLAPVAPAVETAPLDLDALPGFAP